MGIGKAIANGIGATFRKFRIVIVLYAVNLAFGLVVALPLMALVQNELGGSLLGLSVRPVDLMWIGEAVLKHQDALAAMAAGAAAAGLGYLALQIFLNGGLVGRLVDREGPAGTRPLIERFIDGGKVVQDAWMQEARGRVEKARRFLPAEECG